MGRIGKELAQVIAVKLLTKNAKLVEENHQKFLKEYTAVYKKSIPDAVFELAKETRRFLRYCISLSAASDFGWKAIRLTEELPSDTGYGTFTPKGADREKLVKLYEGWQNEKIDYLALHEQVKNSIYALRTTARLEKEWAEAAKFLPKAKPVLPAANLDNIKSKIK
jgi:hypothetical protein